MKLKLLLISMLLTTVAMAQYAPAGDKIKTEWAEKVSPENALPEYPRPMMVRPDWKNLNGLWQYAITPKGERAPKQYEGDILVPFCIESALSGVQKEVGPDNALWYQKTFSVPSNWFCSSRKFWLAFRSGSLSATAISLLNALVT